MSDIRFNQWLHNSGTGGVSQVDGGHVGIGTTNPLIPVGSGNTAILNVGVVTANSYYGSGANLTSLPAANLTGTLPAISGANLTSLPTQVTIANNGNDRIITGGSGVNLNGEANLQFDGTNLFMSNELRHLGDPDTKIGFDTDTIRLETAGTERLRITSGGQVCIGTNTAVRALTIKQPGQIHLESTDTGNWLGVSLKGSSGTNNYNAYFGMLDSNGNFFIDNGSNGDDFVITQSGMITCSGRVNIGTSGTLKAEINNAVSGHQFISQCSDNNDGFEIYQQHGSTTTRNTLAVYDNRTGSKQSSLVMRGDGVKITTSRGLNYAKTYEFNYNDGAPGGVQTKNLATVVNYSGTCSAVAEVTYVGVYATAQNLIAGGKWICAVRRANSNSAWAQTAEEVALSGNGANSSLDLYWSSGVLKAQTVGAWMGWTVNVRITIVNGDITVNV